GTFTPGVGSWTCLADGTVLVTTIETDFNGSGDTSISNNERLTQKLTVVDLNTLQATHRIITSIPLNNNPLGPGTSTKGCTPSGTAPFILCDPAPYKRIRPALADIP